MGEIGRDLGAGPADEPGGIGHGDRESDERHKDDGDGEDAGHGRDSGCGWWLL